MVVEFLLRATHIAGLIKRNCSRTSFHAFREGWTLLYCVAVSWFLTDFGVYFFGRSCILQSSLVLKDFELPHICSLHFKKIDLYSNRTRLCLLFRIRPHFRSFQSIVAAFVWDL